ncbi:MAG TPA: 30S ribosomal protein S16 [Fermentimonas sp.]|nr:30S ribosomal protein S16 [Fermentimonas sp.]
MAVKIRMQRHGSKKRPFYFIVVANSTVSRDGKFIEKIGTYNPLTVPATVELNRESALNWLNKGAQPSNTVRRILSFKGVLYMKHLQRGVSLGLFDEAEAEKRFVEWEEKHSAEFASKSEADKQARKEARSAIAAEAAKRVAERNEARRAEMEAKLKEAEEEAKAAEENTEEVTNQEDEATNAEDTGDKTEEA